MFIWKKTSPINWKIALHAFFSSSVLYLIVFTICSQFSLTMCLRVFVSTSSQVIVCAINNQLFIDLRRGCDPGLKSLTCESWRRRQSRKQPKQMTTAKQKRAEATKPRIWHTKPFFFKARRSSTVNVIPSAAKEDHKWYKNWSKSPSRRIRSKVPHSIVYHCLSISLSRSLSLHTETRTIDVHQLWIHRLYE